MGEDTEGMVESTSKLRGLVKGYTGFDIMQDEDTFKSIYDIIVGIGEKWKDLTDIQQAGLLEALAGKRAGNALAAALNNIDDLKAAYETAEKSAGSAQKEQENYEKSIQYSIDRLKATAQDLAQDFIKSDWIKTAVDGLNSILELVDKLVEHTGSLVPILTTIAGIIVSIKATQGIGNIAEAIQKFNGKDNKTSILSGLKSLFNKTPNEEILEATKAIDVIKSRFGEVTEENKDLWNDYVLKRYGKSLEELNETANTTNRSFKDFFDKNKTGNSIIGQLAKTLGMNSGALVGWGLAIAGVTYSIYKLATAQSEMNKRVKEANDEYKKQNSSIEDYRKRALELQAVANNNKKSLEEQQTARKNLLDLQSQMIEQFGSEAGKVDILTSSVNNLNSAFDNLNEKKYQEFLNKANDNSWDWDDSFGKNVSKVFKRGGASNIEDIINQYEKFESSIKFGLFDTKTANLLISELESRGVNAYLDSDENTDELFVKGVNNAQNYYDAILDIQEKYRNKSDNIAKQLNSILTKEVNETYEKLYDEKKGIASSYNTVFEHDIIGKTYFSEVKRLQELKDSILKARTENDEETLNKSLEQYQNLIDEVVKKSNNNSSIKNWFADFSSEIQSELSKQEFIAKVNPELQTSDSHKFEVFKRQIAHSVDPHMYDDEITSLIMNYDNFGYNDIINKYGQQIADIVKYIYEQYSEYGIPIDFTIGELNVPNKVINELKKKFGEKISNLSEEDLDIVKGIPEAVNMSWEKLAQTIGEIKSQSVELSRSEMIDSIMEMTDGFDVLDEIYADIYDKGSFDFAKLDSKKFSESFKDLKDEYTEFIDIVSASPDDINAAQEAFNKLADAYIEKKGGLAGLTEENKQIAIDMLSNMGISNAEAVVNAKLSKSKNDLAIQNQFLKETGIELENATYAEINSLLAEGVILPQTAAKMADFRLKKIDLNNAPINTKADCEELLNLAKTAGYSSLVIEKLEVLKNRLSNKSGFGVTNEEKNNINNAIKNVLSEAKSEIEGVDFTIPTVEFGGGKATQEAKDAAESSKEIIDWIEIALSRVQRNITNLGKTVSATYRTWSKRNSALKEEIGEINKEIQLQQIAYNSYMRDAEAVPLAEYYKKLVREGAMFAETIADKGLKKNIDQYKELYEKALAASDAIEDLNSNIVDLAKTKFNNVKSEFDGFISEIDHFTSMVDKELSHVENMGKIAGKSFYKAKMNQSDEKLAQLKEERGALERALNDALANGIEVGSSDYNELRDSIYSVDEAIADCTYETEELKKKMKEIAKLNFEDLKSQFESAIGIITSQIDLTDSIVSMTENAGYIASEQYYKSLIAGSKENVSALRKEYTRLSDELNKAVASGDVEKFDENWYSMREQISSVKNELVDAASKVIDFTNALRQIQWDMFDRGVDQIGKLVDETQFFIDLLSYEDLFDKDTGDWTNAGITTRGLMVEKYQSYVDQANAYGKEAADIKKLLEEDPKNTKLLDRYYELLSLQREAILNTKEEKKAIEDLYQNSFDNLLERIKKLIDEFKKALQTQKDLYDYEKNINSATSDISSTKKQLLATQGMSDTEEGKQIIQKLRQQLKDQEQNLEELEYQKYLDDQNQLLDDFYSDLEEWLNGRLDNIDDLFTQAVEATNFNGLLIDTTLHETANSVKYTMTDEFKKIWNSYASEGGIAASSLNILTLTNDTTTDIRLKMDELATEARLEEFFNGDDLRLLQELTSVNNNTSAMNYAISLMDAAINQISSNIVEFSGNIGNKINAGSNKIVDAINSKNYVVNVSVSGGGSTSTSTSGGSSSSSSSTSNAQTKHWIFNGIEYSSYAAAEKAQSIVANDYASNMANNMMAKGYYSNKSRAYVVNQYLDEYKKNHLITTKVYAKGGVIPDDDNFLDVIAKSLGEDHMVAAKEGERILTSSQNVAFEKLVDNLGNLDILSGVIDNKIPNVRGFNSYSNGTTIGDINISLPNITNKQEFVNWLKTDGQIERVIQSMTIGRLNGGNSYAKMKY